MIPLWTSRKRSPRARTGTGSARTTATATATVTGATETAGEMMSVTAGAMTIATGTAGETTIASVTGAVIGIERMKIGGIATADVARPLRLLIQCRVSRRRRCVTT